MPLTPFFCELCQKSYQRSNELEAHENSYDHQHKKRLRDMKAMTRNPTSIVSNSRAERRRKEQSEILGGNIQAGGADERAGGSRAADGERGFKPIGFARNAGVDPGRADGKSTGRDGGDGGAMTPGQGAGEDGYVTRRGPIPWEELENINDILDLDTMRPGDVQRLVDVQNEYMLSRTQKGRYDAVWKTIAARRDRDNRARSESSDGAIGLGA